MNTRGISIYILNLNFEKEKKKKSRIRTHETGFCDTEWQLRRNHVCRMTVKFMSSTRVHGNRVAGSKQSNNFTVN